MKELVETILNTKLRHFRFSCPSNITDLVFLEIEKSYMSDYESAVKYKGSDNINKFIGKTVRALWGLENRGRYNNPQSRLITSYEKHSNH